MGVIYDVFGERKRKEVLQDTWGHLAPKKQEKHTGWMVFCCACYGGGHELIDSDFPTVDDSPWFYEDMQAFMRQEIGKLARQRNQDGKTEYNGLFKFEGTYTKFKNEGFRFSGKVRRIDMARL